MLATSSVAWLGDSWSVNHQVHGYAPKWTRQALLTQNLGLLSDRFSGIPRSTCGVGRRDGKRLRGTVEEGRKGNAVHVTAALRDISKSILLCSWHSSSIFSSMF